MIFKPILCLDFDGVIHRYDSKWEGPLIIKDDVTDGFFEWLHEAVKVFDVVVYSSRSSTPHATGEMEYWLRVQYKKWSNGENMPARMVRFVAEKPPAFLQIDDRAICFTGSWEALDPDTLLKFKPWNKK